MVIHGICPGSLLQQPQSRKLKVQHGWRLNYHPYACTHMFSRRTDIELMDMDKTVPVLEPPSLNLR